MKKDRKNEIDNLLADITLAVENADWKQVSMLSIAILALNPDNKAAKGYLQLTENKIELIEAASHPETSLEDVTEKAQKTLLSVASGSFVGRKTEMGRLKAAMEEVLSGQGRMVMLVGEPGIGKTRIAEELKTYAGLRGAQVLWGRCYEAKGAPPYWPWIQAIRSYVRECSPKRLSSEMGSGGGVIAELISDVREKLPDLPKPVVLDDPESSRFRLFDAVTTFLKSASKAQALVIVLDDLHWADTPTLVFLEFVAHELSGSRLLVVGTYRDVELRRTHPLQKTLGDLTRERLFERVLLRGLSEEDVARFIELASGIKPPQELTTAVFTHTEGNPLFVIEVVRLLVQQGDLKPEEVRKRKRWSLGIPEGVREVIGRRLDHLSARCNEVLIVAAVMGRSFMADLLSKLMDDIAEDRLLEVLEEALAARVLTELADTVGNYQFTHSLVQQTLLEELTTTHKVRLHARIAESLEELYGDEADKHSSELAQHYREAETVLGTEKLVKYCHLAGQQALSSFAYEEAMHHFEKALRGKDGAPTDDTQASSLFGLAQAKRFLRLDSNESLDAQYEQAFGYFERMKNTARAAEIATHDSWSNIRKVVEICSRAIKLAESGSAEECRLLTSLGAAEYEIDRDYKKTEACLIRAQEIAEKINDPALKFRVLSGWSKPFLYQTLDYNLAIEKCLEAIEVAKGVDDKFSEFWVRFQLSWMYIGAKADLKNARIHTKAALDLAERTRIPGLIIPALIINSNNETIAGNWEAALTCINKAIEIHPDGWHQNAYRARYHYELGNVKEAERDVEKYLEIIGSTPGPRRDINQYGIKYILRLVHLSDNQELLPIAEESAKELLTESQRLSPEDKRELDVYFGNIAILRQDRAQASKYYLKAMKTESETILPERRPYYGLLAQTAGMLEESSKHFEEGYTAFRKAGFRSLLAWVCYDYSGLLLERNNADNLKKAEELLVEGLGLSQQMGMKLLEGRIKARIKKLKDSLGGKPTYPDGLTGREVEVLQLIVLGLINRDIGRKLNISENTVATHVRHIHEKTGTSNRAEATAYAIRQGLVGQ